MLRKSAETPDEPETKAKGLFASLDKDNDGIITEEEIMAASAAQGKPRFSANTAYTAKSAANELQSLSYDFMAMINATHTNGNQPQAQVSPLFTKTMAIVIVINALVLGAEAQYHDGKAHTVWKVFNHCFTAIYLAEVILKLVLLKLRYFTRFWNMMDFALTVAGILEMWILAHLFDKKKSSGYSVLRMARLIRVMRVLKLQKDLTMVVEGIMGALASIAWITLLLGSAIYVFAIACTFLIGTYTYAPVTEDALIHFETFDNKEYFGNLLKSMLTLYNIAILTEWPEIVRPMMKHQPYLIPLLVGMMMFLTFGVLNVMIGVIVRNTEDVRLNELEMLEKENQRRKLELVHAIWNSGGLSCSADLQQILKDIDLPLGFAMEDLCRILDTDGSGNLERDEFEFGLCRLITGNNNGFHQTCIVMNNLALIRKDLMNAVAKVSKKVDVLQQKIDELTKLSSTVHDLERVVDYMVRRESLFSEQC